jgi:hypothetical protein
MLIDCTESKRVKAFRLAIARGIPKFPNNKDTLKLLTSEPLGSLLIHYMNWAIRYVAMRPRTVDIEPTASSDARWSALKTEIAAFLEKVKNGRDLTPHLSLKPHTRGYTPASSGTGVSVDRWADKDFLLNVMGYHHFHLGPDIEAEGFARRTDHVLFAKVSRDRFISVAILNHSVFDTSRSQAGNMTKERKRLWGIFNEHSSRDRLPGSFYIPTMITTSGHTHQLVRLAHDYTYVVQEIDPKLDDISYILGMYQQVGLSCPKKPKLAWRLDSLDLGILDSSSNTFFVLRYGPN